MRLISRKADEENGCCAERTMAAPLIDREQRRRLIGRRRRWPLLSNIRVAIRKCGSRTRTWELCVVRWTMIRACTEGEAQAQAMRRASSLLAFLQNCLAMKQRATSRLSLDTTQRLPGDDAPEVATESTKHHHYVPLDPPPHRPNPASAHPPLPPAENIPGAPRT